MSSIHWLPSKFTTATFVILRCHVSVSNDNWLLKVNFDLLTHFASSMLLCILIPQQNHQTAAVCVSCMLPSCFCILIPQQNHETNMPNWRSRRLPKTMKKACRLKPSKSLSLQALRLQAPQPSWYPFQPGFGSWVYFGVCYGIRMIPIPALFPWESLPVMVPAPVLESAPLLELALEIQLYSL